MLVCFVLCAKVSGERLQDQWSSGFIRGFANLYNSRATVA